jgi:hypothetical protein
MLVYNEREGGGVVALPLISTLADEGTFLLCPPCLYSRKCLDKCGAGLPAGSVLVFESPPSAFPSFARNVSQVSTRPPHARELNLLGDVHFERRYLNVDI